MLVSRDATISGALKHGESLLTEAGFVLAPRRHAELLLGSVLGFDRTSLYLHSVERIGAERAEIYGKFLERRLAGEPVQHIVGWTPFYGHKFLVGKGVFIPRFDSEVIAERGIQILRTQPGEERPLRILDLCTGCGVLGLTVALEMPNSCVILVDNEVNPLKFAALNAQASGVGHRVSVVKWDALSEPPESWSHRFDLILANPPYIPLNEIDKLHPDVKLGEPTSALTDGGDGLMFYQRWAKTVPGLLRPGGAFITEVGDGAAERVNEIFSSAFAELSVLRDVSGVDRAIEAR